MFMVQIHSSDGWVVAGEGESPEEAFLAAKNHAMEANSQIADAFAEKEEEQPTFTHEPDSLSGFIKSLPEDCRNNPNLLFVLEKYQINNLNAEKYRKSPHRMEFVVREIRKNRQ